VRVSSTVEVRGVVEAFDGAVGLGRIVLDDGREVAFHATQLDGGTRTIAVGTTVSAHLVPWHLGVLEATAIAPVRPGTPGPP
jgi:cold shock CspA family protein